MNTKKKNTNKMPNSNRMIGISSLFRDENDQLKMIFDKEDGSQTIKSSSKFEGLQNLKFMPGTIRSPSRDLQASVYASVHHYAEYSKSGNSGDADRDSITSDVLFAASDSFENFASKNFQLKDAQPDCFSRAPLLNSLLPPKDKNTHLAAMSSWITILKIMGDFPEYDYTSVKSMDSRPIPFNFIREHFAKKYSKKDIDDAIKKYEELGVNPQTDCTSVPFLFPGQQVLDHIQFLCCLGMLKNSLRDEIFCQILKQMTQNPSQNSLSRGWLLLFLIVGIFHPTETLMPSLLTFLRESESEIASKVEYSLRRSLRNGTRCYPTGWSEFQAMKNYKPIFVPVILMTGDRLLVRVDSSTTVKELCQSIARSLGLKETMGFSVFATLFDKISYLGDSSHRIMDTICECEYFAKAASVNESSAPWRLYFRKEYFPPWETHVTDPIAVNLIYAQVMRGITVEEYTLEDSRLQYFAALKYFINNEELSLSKLTKIVEKLLPKSSINRRPVSEWVNLISEIFKKDFQHSRRTPLSCKTEVVDFAMKHLHKSFCRLFEIKQFTSPRHKLTRVTGAIHQKGLTIVDADEEEKILLPYEEMVIVKKKGAWLHILDVRGANNMVEAHQVDELYAVLNTFLEELSHNSRVTVALCQCNVPEKQNFSSSLHIRNGDLIVLEEPFKLFKDSEYIVGKCLRTEREGEFSKDIIHPLAIAGIPNDTHLNTLASQLKNTEWSQEHVGRFYSYTLDEYGKEHLQPVELSMTKMLSRTSLKRNGFSDNWKHSKEPIKHPLSKRIQMRADLKHCACKIYQAILMYMEDIRRIEAISDIVLATDKIFEIAVRNKHLRNEIYIQLIKQLTENDDVTSRNKGWVLMWLLTGCVIPQGDMYQELLKFLQVSESCLAEQCFNRIKILRLSGPRLYPPHTLEHLAVSAHCVDPIKLEIILSDSSVKKVEVFSHTMVMDICDKIISKLGLKSSFGYGLFLKTKNRVVPLVDNDYIMDILGHMEIYFMSQPLQVKDKSYKFQFMKKLWSLDDVKEDLVADEQFSYYQDLPNYVAGFHDCPLATAVKLSAFIFKATHEKTEIDNTNFREVIIPDKFIPLMTKENWMREIYGELQSIKTYTKSEAKVAFVNITKGFRTYGSVFFEIQMPENPNSLQLAVNRNGVLIVDPATKQVFHSMNFQQIRNWIHECGKFNLIVDNEHTGSERIFFQIERFQGELLDDLIMANVEFSLNSKFKNFQVFAGAKRGETIC
ncbi:myosin-VIIa [Octopus sinensis]|nr:myosin-VIIa [Octopus sinensis]XP_036361843.1 myosin-VIIa [Octopus sinensis]